MVSRGARREVTLSICFALGAVASCGGQETDPLIGLDASMPTPDSSLDAKPVDAEDIQLDGSPNDASVDLGGRADAALLDTASPDAASPEAEVLCQPCDEAVPCTTAGSICLTNQTTGEQFCGLDCRMDAAVCPRGSACFELDEGQAQCAPTNATCNGWPPSDLGAPCQADAECRHGAQTCIYGFCSTACATDADCAAGVRACVDGYCLPDALSGPEGCGVGPTSCARAGGCGDGRVCSDTLLPETPQRFCTVACADTSTCAPTETCAVVGAVRLCLPSPCACVEASDPDDLLSHALSLTGLDRCTALFASATLDLFPANVRADAFRLGFFDRIHRNGLTAVDWGQGVVTELSAAAVHSQPVSRLISSAAALLDHPLSAPIMPVAPGPTLEGALIRLFMLDGRALRPGVAAAAFADVPLPVQEAVARIVEAEVQLLEARKQMFDDAGLSPAALDTLFLDLPGTLIAAGGGFPYGDAAMVALFSETIRFERLYRASANLAATIESISWAGLGEGGPFDVSMNTPFGRLVVRDGRDQRLDDQASYLLVVDLGGDDVYTAPVASTQRREHGVSVLVDVNGDDVYGYPEVGNVAEVAFVPPADEAGRGLFGRPASRSRIPRQGGAILGTALLFDLAGSDRYTSLKLSQGASVGGVGVLFDAAGIDTYACEQGCQGAASFGIGLLADLGDGDHYSGVQSVQGFAGVKGFGYLHDQEGDDAYDALLGDPSFGGTILYANPQNPSGSNTSLAQGAGFGRRADADGTYASGGLGILRDVSGDDHYTADIFGQATGYWFGTGVLSDGSGQDVYNGRWYVQGSGAHFAVSLFYEGAGDDRYNEGLPTVDGQIGGVIMATATGQGHDLSVGFLVDVAGNDHYVAPGLGLGGGNDNGMGVFIDLSGDDRYDVPDGRTFGGAGTGDRGAAFDDALCLGLFIDADGHDEYPLVGLESLIGEEREWSLEMRAPMRKPGDHGAGIDTTGGHVRLPPGLVP